MLFVVHIDGQHWTEDFFAHSAVHRVLGEDHGWLDEVALRFVVVASSDDLYPWCSLGLVDVLRDFVEGFFVNYGIDEVAKILCATHTHGCQIFQHVVFHILPQVGWDIGSRSGRAFLTLVFEGTAYEAYGNSFCVSRFVGQNKIFTARFSYDSRVGFVAGDVFTDSFPNMLEYAGGTCKVDSCKIRVFEDYLTCGRAIHIHQVDDAVGNSSFLENFHQHLGGIDLRIGRFPYDGIAHHGCRSRQIARNGGKIEGGQRKHKAFKWALLESVPYAWPGNRRLLGVDFAKVLYVEAQKVDELTGSIDFGLKGIFGLPQHGGGIDFSSVRSCKEVGCFQKNRCALLPTKSFPGFFGAQGRLDGLLDVGAVSFVKVS